MAPPNTRTPSRPPLTTRIKASFEGKRSKSEVQSPTHANGNGFITQDSDSLRAAIDEAINSETFQNAIAANLAKLIKPSIKSALDTIQPVVEAVYNHEVLLRKTNRSVENILERMETNLEAHAHQRDSMVETHGVELGDAPAADAVDETKPAEEKHTAPTEEDKAPTIQDRAVGPSTPSDNFEQFKQLLDESNARTAASLSELSSSIEASNGRIAEVVQGISDIQATARPAKESVDALMAFSEQSATTAAVMQAQLDQLNADVGIIMDNIGSDLGKNVQAIHDKVAAQDTSLLSSHTTKLDAIATDLGALKGHSDSMEKLEAISAELTGLKGSVEAGIASNTEGFTTLGSQITNMMATVEGHTDTLCEMKTKGANPEILAALQQSNDSHATHAAALVELKERSLGAVSAPASTPEEAGPETTAALQDLKADLASLKENIAAGLTSNNETVTGLGAKIDSVLTSVESHRAPEILAAVQQSNESHASHAAALEEIKSLRAGPAPAADSGNLAALEAQVGSIITMLDAHTSALDEIKTANSNHATVLEEVKSLGSPPSPADNAALESQIGALAATLDTHTSALDEIKSASGLHSSALEELKTTSASHASALEEVKSLGSPPSPADNTALESQIGALAATLDTHSSALDEIKSASGLHSLALEELKTASASHASALEEVKALGSTPPPAENNLSGLESQIAALTATLDAHTSALDEIKSTDGLHSTALDEIKATGTSHTLALENVRSLGADSNNLGALESEIAAIVATLALHTSTLDELKSTSSSHNAAVVNTLDTHTSALDELKSTSSSHNAAVVNALDTHTSALDEIKSTTTSHVTALEQSKSLSEAQLATHNNNLSALEAQVAAIVATLEAHTAVLDQIKASGAASSTAVVPASNPEGLEGHFSTIIETLDAHTNLLNELKDDVSAEILTTLHELGQSQAQHTDMLTEIREADVSDEILTLLHASGESHATTGSTLDQIHANVRSLNESHAAHTTALDEIKSRSIQSAPATEGSSSGALEAKIDGIASTLESYNAALSSIQESHASHTEVLNEIRDATAICNESHADHAIALSEIKEISSASNEAHSSHIAALADIKEATTVSNEAHASHTATLAELKAVQLSSAPAASGSESPDIAALETHINTIITTLENQNTTLSSIKESASDLSVLEAVKTSHELLTSHTSLLDTIKDNSSHEDIFSNISALKSLIEESKSGIDEHSALIRDLHSDTKETHSNLTSAIAGLALGGAAGAGADSLASHESDNHSTEILTEVKAVKEKVDFVVSQIGINHTTVTTSITTLSDELKAEIDATGTQITESITAMDGDIKAINLGPMTLAVDQCGQVVKDHSAQIDSLEGHVQANNCKLSDLHEGVHLNETGIAQLRDHAGTREVVSEPVPEALWFGSGSGSPSAKRSSNPFDRLQEDEPVDEDEEPVLEAIPEIDIPLDESPVMERFRQEALPPAIDEEEIAHLEPEIPLEEVEKELPADSTRDVAPAPQPEEIPEFAHKPAPVIDEFEGEPEREITEESGEVHAEPQPEYLEESRDEVQEPHDAELEEVKEEEHLEERRDEVQQPHDAELEEVKEEATVEDTPSAHDEEMAEEHSTTASYQEEMAEEVAPNLQTDEQACVQENKSIHEDAPAEPEDYREPGLEPQLIEVPTEESEIGYGPSEAQAILQHHDPEPEPDNTEEPTEIIPEPESESAHEISAAAPHEDHHATPEPAHILGEDLDEAVTSPAPVAEETPQEHEHDVTSPLPSHEPEEPEHPAPIEPEPEP